MGRDRIYFVSDVHIGLGVKDSAEREGRFIDWLRNIPRESTKAVYLMGDIWDFWYEYKDVVPRVGARVIAQFIDLIDSGVELYFFEGNHDMWSFSYFESLGIKKLAQPFYVELGGKTFCLGHGDGLGKVKKSYNFMLKVFRSKVTRVLFSSMHPWLGYRLGLGWSNSSRRTHTPYTFKAEKEPLYQFAVEAEKSRHADYYVFGHYHDKVDLTMPTGSRFFVLKDWMDGGYPCLVYNTATSELRCSDDLS